MLQRQKKPPSKAAGHTQARQEMPEQDGEALQQAHARKIERIFPDPKTGLTSQQAAELLTPYEGKPILDIPADVLDHASAILEGAQMLDKKWSRLMKV